MNTLLSVSVEDLVLLCDALVIAKERALYDEKRCLECVSSCSSETLVASFMRGAELRRIEINNYQRLLNKLRSV